MRYLLLLIPIGVIVALIWSVNSMLKQSKKDWAILYDLEQRASKVTTKEEIEKLHFEVVETHKKIYNKYVSAKLCVVEGYLRGLYQKYV